MGAVVAGLFLGDPADRVDVHPDVPKKPYPRAAQVVM
jgi:hypothetical protein